MPLVRSSATRRVPSSKRPASSSSETSNSNEEGGGVSGVGSFESSGSFTIPDGVFGEGVFLVFKGVLKETRAAFLVPFVSTF
jgi:hypothetical protein